MKRVVSILVIAAFLAAPMLVAAQQAAKKAPATKAEAVTMTGMVDAFKDKKGKVTGYTLKTDTETFMLKGKKLSAMVGKKVEATGIVSTAKGGKKVLSVKQIKEVM